MDFGTTASVFGLKMSGFIMGCSLDKLAFKSAHEALQHFGGKKHRFKMDKHLKIVAQEGYAIQIKGKYFLFKVL